MPTRGRQRTKTAARRREILEAALSCFDQLGFEGATMGEIRRRSGASTGSIYHHFGGKSELADALYLEGIRDYQRGFLEALEAHPDAREGVAAVVRYHLSWVEGHREWARFLFERRRGEAGATGQAVKEQNEAFFVGVTAWFRPHIESGRLRWFPLDVYVSILLGPCQDFARQLLSGRARTSLDEAAAAIGEATWQALRASEP